jgi:hypothetical protein
MNTPEPNAPLTFAELCERIRPHLTDPDVVLTEEMVSAGCWLGAMMQMALCIAAGKPIRSPAELPESSGYAPLLVENGWDPGWARAAAAVAVRHGRRRAAESRWIRPVYGAIRFLAQPGRQRRSILRRAKFLLSISEKTTTIETIFCQAGLAEHGFLGLLKFVVEGRDVDLARIAAIAADLVPRLPVVRGPKVSATSAAHEFILENDPGIAPTRARYARGDRPDQYGDTLTRATRREFRNPNYDGRPVRRRVNARKAGR